MFYSPIRLFYYLLKCLRMDDRDWMYTGCPNKMEMTKEWIDKSSVFLKKSFANIKGKPRRTWCPCAVSANGRRQTKGVMGNILSTMVL